MLRDNLGWWIAGAVVLLLLTASVLGATRRAGNTAAGSASGRFGRRPHRDSFRPEGDADSAEPPLKRAAVIVNPMKFSDLGAVRARVERGCLEAGWGKPIWLETTLADPGTGQARAAVAEGAVVVCPLGGDGTVRAVAAGLVASETPLGLLSGGTGNLLARNLDLPVDSLENALRVALTGQNQRVDVGRLTVDRSGEHEDPEQHVFLVMAGLGFDAAVMAGAPERLKSAVGWGAYVVSGMRNLHGPQFRVRVRVDGGPEFSRRTRSVVIGNCGRLRGGLVLMPEAKIDDNRLDLVLLSPKGVVGWTAVAGRLLSRRHKGHPIVDHHSGREVTVRADRPEHVQLDGDPIGRATAIAATVDPLALVVRVAHRTPTAR